MGTGNGSGDSGFVARLAAGEPDARHRLATHYAQLLRAIARNRAPGRSSAFLDDVVNESLARVLAAVQGNQIRDHDHFASYCIGVCNRVVQELRRKDDREPLNGDAVPERVSSDTPETLAVRRQELEAVDEALSSLGTRDRTLFERIVVQGEDKDELCRQYGVKRGHLRVLLHRARERFTAALARQRSTRNVS